MNHKKSPLFSALCFLSIIGSGLAFIAYFFAAIYFKKTSELIIEYSSWHSTESISPLYFTLLMALYAISLAGVIRIWKLNRDGFFLYWVTQIIILFVPVIWIEWSAFSVTNSIFTVVFIGGYLLYYKTLK